MPRGDGKTVFEVPGPPRRKIKRYDVDEKFAKSKKLQKRLLDPIWKDGNGYYDPKDNTRMHRPGSQKK